MKIFNNFCLLFLLLASVSSEIIQIFKSTNYINRYLSNVLTYLHQNDFDFLVSKGSKLSFNEKSSYFDQKSLQVYIKKYHNSTYSINPVYSYKKEIFIINVPSFFIGSVDARFIIENGFASVFDTVGTINFSLDLTINALMSSTANGNSPFTFNIRTTFDPTFNITLDLDNKPDFDANSVAKSFLQKILEKKLVKIANKVNLDSENALNGLGIQKNHKFKFWDIPKVFRLNLTDFLGTTRRKSGFVEKFRSELSTKSKVIKIDQETNYQFNSIDGNHQMFIPLSIFNAMGKEISTFKTNFTIKETLPSDLFLINPYFFKKIAPNYDQSFDDDISVSGTIHDIKVDFLSQNLYSDMDILIENKKRKLLALTNKCKFNLMNSYSSGILNFQISLDSFKIGVSQNYIQNYLDERTLNRFVRTFLFNRLRFRFLFDKAYSLDLNKIFQTIEFVKITNGGILVSGDNQNN